MAIGHLENLNKPDWRFYDVPQDDNPEYQLAESIAAEFTDIVGIGCTYYINDTATEPDQLYGEKMNVTYKEGKESKIVFELAEIPTIYSMFGVMAQDTIVSYIPRYIYKRDISQTEPSKVGDVIKVPLYPSDFSDDFSRGGRTFEIIHVAQDTSIFMYRSLVYVFNLIPYRYSEESLDAAIVSSDVSPESPHISQFGDNEWVDDHKDVDGDVDTKIYGY